MSKARDPKALVSEGGAVAVYGVEVTDANHGSDLAAGSRG